MERNFPQDTMYQSTQSDPKLCFILAPNSRKLEEYPLEIL